MNSLPAARFTVSIPELAAELGMNAGGLALRLQEAGHEVRLRHRHPAHDRPVNCVLSTTAQWAREQHAKARGTPEELAHWFTAEQAARALGMSVRAFHCRRCQGSLKGKLEARRLHGPGVVGKQTRYSPADVAREAARIGIRPRSQPRGTVSTRELGELLGMTRRDLSRWRGAGCPFVRVVDDDCFYHPTEVLVWAERRTFTKATPQKYIAGHARRLERLRQHIAEQQQGKAA